MDPNVVALYQQAQSIKQLVLNYEHLGPLGKAFIKMLHNHSVTNNQSSKDIMVDFYRPDMGLVYPNVMENGQLVLHSYHFVAADSNLLSIKGCNIEVADDTWEQRVFNMDSIKQNKDSLHINYQGGAKWAEVWMVTEGSSNYAGSLDFSNFNTLMLELKGDIGGKKSC